MPGTEHQTPEPFFDLQADGSLLPRPLGRSPWSADMMHGRLLAGLAARQLESGLDPAFRCARLTVDMFRFPPMKPVTVGTSVVRDGRRVKVFQVDLAIEGVAVARATALAYRHGTQPPGDVWSPPPWSVPPPESLPEAPPSPQPFPTEFRYPEGGGWGILGQKKVWARDRSKLVGDEQATPLVRAAMAADLASPLSHSSDRGLAFINGDITLYLARYPTDEWIGFEVTGHVSADGIAVGQCTLHDRAGVVGYSVATAVANEPMSPAGSGREG
ncbi:MAG TPA: thioesterase family protein [Acidimicrobiales bacterium]|nr:thioesterase family protein [Acidimicrobiales bacterium]